MSSNAEIFAKYANSKPANIQFSSYNVAGLDKDFLLLVKQYKDRLPSEINVDHLAGESEAHLKLYKEAMATLMHPVYGRFKESAYVSGNVVLYRLMYDGFGHNLEMYEMNRSRRVIKLTDAKVDLSETSLELTSTNGYSLSLERTGETYDTNMYAKDAAPNVVPIWQLELRKDGRRQCLVHTVDLKMD